MLINPPSPAPPPRQHVPSVTTVTNRLYVHPRCHLTGCFPTFWAPKDRDVSRSSGTFVEH